MMLGIPTAPVLLASIVKFAELLEGTVVVLIFVTAGLVLFGAAFFVLHLVIPFSIQKEIEKDQNSAFGIIIGAILIGIALIVAAAIHG